MSDSDDLPDLKGLLSALAGFAKAAQSFPLNDEFAFESSFPEFQSALTVAQESLLLILGNAVAEVRDDESIAFDNIHDPGLWEECADVCDDLVEQVEAYLNDTVSLTPLQQWSTSARIQSTSKFNAMVQATRNDIKKPQEVYTINPHNSRTAVFVPQVRPDKPHGITPLDLTLRDGHGYDTRFGELKSFKPREPVDWIAPDQHCPHQYETEIRSFSYTPQQLRAVEPSQQKIAVKENIQAVWIDTEDALAELAQKLKKVDVVALDLEAHSLRSFAGLVCLMQISIRISDIIENYLVDTLKLHGVINKHLASVLANPKIVKVLHGADSDVQWLQRDFGLYIVNLFDTGRAARALQFPKMSYAFLLKHYAGLDADKSQQLADWRQRPLPVHMQHYAIADTYYLLDIYERLKWDLQQHPVSSIEYVLDESRKVCLIRYCPDPFNPDGYKKLLRERNSTRTDLQTTQTAVLKSLWDWRDQAARAHDESPHFVCTNTQLVRMALASTSNMSISRLEGLFNPVPPLILRLAPEILDRIRSAQTQQDDYDDAGDDAEVAAPTTSSAFFKPAVEEDKGRRDMMSPVLGTEALYEQAGWMTPLDIASNDEEDVVEGNEDDEPRRLISLHTINQDYQAQNFAEHNLMFQPTRGRGRSVDEALVRTARSLSPSRPKSAPGETLEDQVEMARSSAKQINKNLDLRREAIPAILGLVASKGTEYEMEEAKIEESSEQVDQNADLEEEFVIPRSIREIYMISNRNRRNKKAGSPIPEGGVAATSEKEREELAKADAILAARGNAVAGYFDENLSGSPGKRPRTRSGRESEESVPDAALTVPSKEDDLGFLKEIGYIKPHEQLDDVLNPRRGENTAVDDDEKPSEGLEDLAAAPSSNPFFAGAALQGGPLTQQTKDKTRKSGTGKGKQNRARQERPEKKDARTHAYRKR